MSEEKSRVLSSARVLIAPSYEKGWGISMAEALATGLPVVAYRLAILDEVFGDAYVAVEVGNVDSLTTATRRLFEDDSTAARLGEQGRAAVARYDLERIAQEELKVILDRCEAG